MFQPISPIRSFATRGRPVGRNKPSIRSTTSPLGQTTMSSRTNSPASGTKAPSEMPTARSDAVNASKPVAKNIRKPERMRSWKGGVSKIMKRSQDHLKAQKKLSKTSTGSSSIQSTVSASNEPEESTQSSNQSPIEMPAHERRESKRTANSSPIDPAYDHDAKRFKDDQGDERPISSIVGQDEPQSFLDLDSSSDEDSPVVRRADSVRAGKPQLVRHVSKTAQKVEPIDTSDRSMEKASKVLGQPLRNLYDLTPAEEKKRFDFIVGGPEEALSRLEGRSTGMIPESTSSVTDPDSSKETYVDAGDASHPEASDKVSSLPTPTITSPLRSNPLSDTEKARLSRTLSAPTSYISNRNSDKRVTLRPSDLIIHTPNHDHRLFRESIVTTPYPQAFPVVDTSDITALPHVSEKDSSQRIPTQSTTAADTPPSSKTDRFPSPHYNDDNEHLYLQLELSRHPSSITTIEIIIPTRDRPTYNDEHLFTSIRSSYHTQLGLNRRIFSARKLVHVSPGNSDMYQLDSTSFVNHLRSPRLGRKRKGWLIWLRSVQPVREGEESPATARELMFASKEKKSLSLSPAVAASHPNSAGGRMSYQSGLSALSRKGMVPRMPFQRSERGNTLPKLVLHYRFDVLWIGMAMIVVVVAAVLSIVLWVLFGVPGMTVGESASVVLGGGKVGWKRDADVRVLTGLVLGVVVLMLGMLGVGGWVGASWVLL